MEEILHQLLYEFLPSFAMMYLGVEVQQDRSFLIPTSELKPEKHLERTHQLVGPGVPEVQTPLGMIILPH